MAMATSTLRGLHAQDRDPSKLYRNEGAGKPFVDVAKAMGLDAPGETRQSSFVDFDNDGDLDFFVGLRDAPNMLFRNDGESFVSVGKEMGIDDPRRTVASSGSTWTKTAISMYSWATRTGI